MTCLTCIHSQTEWQTTPEGAIRRWERCAVTLKPIYCFVYRTIEFCNKHPYQNISNLAFDYRDKLCRYYVHFNVLHNVNNSKQTLTNYY